MLTTLEKSALSGMAGELPSLVHWRNMDTQTLTGIQGNCTNTIDPVGLLFVEELAKMDYKLHPMVAAQTIQRKHISPFLLPNL